MLSILLSITAFLIAIGLLVTVHEFGHFWVARRCGVKVIRFSIGFGKALWTLRDKYGTEYVIAAFPVGGFVKMLDEREEFVPPAQLPFAFNRQSLWARIAIVMAGPLFNFLFAILAYWAMYVIGIVTVAPILGPVPVDSIAAEAGLQRGHEILRVDGKATPSWRAVSLALLPHVGNDEGVTVTSKNRDTQAVTSHTFSLKTWVFQQKEPDILSSLGLTPYQAEIPAVIGTVMPDSPAQQAEILPDDKILSIDGQPTKDWHSLLTYIKVNPGKVVPLVVQRGATKRQLLLEIGQKTDPQGAVIGYLGVRSKSYTWPKELLRIERYSVWTAWRPALKQTLAITGLTFQVITKLLVGKLSVQAISGPVGIAKIAGDTLQIGISYFLGFLAFISISLGVINLLPIPMLDGGHLLFYAIEAVTRKPVSDRIQNVGLRIGIAMIIVMMSIAMVNDVMRFIL